MVTKDRPTGYCRITRRCIAEYYSMGRTRGIVPKVLVDCSWNQSRNTWKYENVAPVVFWEFGALRILPGVERDGFAHSPHSISFPLISIRDQLIKTSIYHLLHTVCCSEARALRLGCWEHIVLRITDLIQHVNLSPGSKKTSGNKTAAGWGCYPLCSRSRIAVPQQCSTARSIRQYSGSI